MKCKGHIHVTVEGGEKIMLCEAEMRNVGFERGEDGEIATENYICDNPECSNYRDIRGESPEDEA